MSEDGQPNVILSDRRRQLLNGQTAEEMGIGDPTYRQYRNQTEQRAKAAFSELLQIAASPEIDNDEVFDSVSVKTLLDLLLTGSSSGLMPGVQLSDFMPHEPDRQYTSELYTEIQRAITQFEFESRSSE